MLNNFNFFFYNENEIFENRVISFIKKLKIYKDFYFSCSIISLNRRFET